ncbi:MAG: thiamine ABC transporter substrate-binding protein [Marmoricola sp.]
MRVFKNRPIILVVAVVAALMASLSACGSSTPSARSKEVIVEVHDAWSMPQSVLNQFTRQTGYKVKIVTHDGVAQLADTIALNAGSPDGDVVYGLDNSYAGRATGANAIADYTPADQPAVSKKYALPGAAAKQLTATDFGDVCVNADDSWFAAHHLAVPKTFDDLLKPQYKNLLAIPAASSSSTGLAWLVGTISAKGTPGWQSYWKALLANGAKVDAGWTQAYEGDFTAGGGKGTYPLVISYSTSPPYTIPTGKKVPTTSALLDTCFRQVEYVGVLAGAANQAGAKAFVDFMVGKQIQSALPENMYMDPVNTAVSVPALWKRWAPLSQKPWPMAQSTIATQRDTWVSQWRELVRAG